MFLNRKYPFPYNYKICIEEVIKIIFFDLDGTLYRTHETCLPPLYELCREYDIHLTEDDKKFLFCSTTDSLLQKTAPHMTQKQREEFIYKLKWREIEKVKKHGRLFDGAEALLHSLSADKIPLAICGMGSKEYTEIVLTKCNIKQYFSHVLHRVEGKTKSQVLSDFLIKEKLIPEDCLMVGDSVTDLNAAKDNMIPFVGVSYGYGAKDIANSSVSIDNIEQLKGEIYRVLIYAHIENNISRLKRPAMLGINGVDTSGKTFFANGLNQYLKLRGFHTQLIHIDDFHNPRAVRGRDASPQGYIDYAFDLPKLNAVLHEIKSQPTDTEMTVLDLDADTYTRKIRLNTTANSIIIVEGVLLYRPPIDDLFDYKIFLDIDFKEVLRRVNDRDVPKYGTNFIDKYMERYIPAQKMYLEKHQPKERCHLLINNNDYAKPGIETM